MTRRVVPILADGLMLLGCGVLLIAPRIWNTPAAELLNVTHPEWSLPVGISLCILGALTILLSAGAGFGLSMEGYYAWSWILIVILAGALLALVLGHLFGGLSGDLLFWSVFGAILAGLLFFTGIARISAFSAISRRAKAHAQSGMPPNAPAAAGGQALQQVPSALLTERMKYAWSWFQYHADQRVKVFNFYLVFVGIVAVAYSTALKEALTSHPSSQPQSATRPGQQPALPTTPQADPGARELRAAWLIFGVALGTIGCAISIAFLMLEIRNKELVDAGGAWLDYLEQYELGVTVRKATNAQNQRPLLAEAMGLFAGGLPGWKSLYSHAISLRLIYVSTGLCFVAAALLCLNILKKMP
jgi:hypothetical protein